MTREMSMAVREPGPGELADRQRKRRFLTVIAALFVAGLPIGFFSAMLEKGNDGGVLTGTLPPAFALAAAATFLVAVIGGGLLLKKRMDEMDVRDNLQANSMAGAVAVIGYPTWFLLWKGGWTGAPDAFWLFLGSFVAATATYLFLKLRR